jgi:hypothetical protein
MIESMEDIYDDLEKRLMDIEKSFFRKDGTAKNAAIGEVSALDDFPPVITRLLKITFSAGGIDAQFEFDAKSARIVDLAGILDSEIHIDESLLNLYDKANELCSIWENVHKTLSNVQGRQEEQENGLEKNLEKDILAVREENLAHEAQEMEAEVEVEVEVEVEPETEAELSASLPDSPSEQRNMEPVRQAAQKISAVGSMDKSADGLSVVEGADITDTQEKYVRDTVAGKQEIQEAETANNASQSNSKFAGIQTGERVSIETLKGNTLTGKLLKKDKDEISIQTGPERVVRVSEKIVKTNNWKVKSAPPLKKEQTIEYAQIKAKSIMGESTLAAGAENGKTYNGKIIGVTAGYAIQAVNRDTAILHKLENLAKAEKDGKGEIKIKEGENLSIARDSFGVVSIETLESFEKKQKELEREKKLQRGSQQVGSRGY